MSTLAALSTIKTFTVALGLVVAFLGVRAYKATRRRPLLLLTVGMFVMTVGAIFEGIAFSAFHRTLDEAHVVEAVFTLVGFMILVYSLYAREHNGP